MFSTNAAKKYFNIEILYFCVFLLLTGSFLAFFLHFKNYLKVELYYPVNTPAAEILYRTISEWCDVSLNDTLVLGIGCCIFP